MGETRYDVSIEESDVGELELAVSVSFPAPTSAELSVTEGAEPFVEHVTVSEAGSGSTRALERTNGSWFSNECASGCTVKYRFLLQLAGQEIDEDEIAMASHNI